MNQRTKLASALLAFAFAFGPAAWSQETQTAGATSTHASVESYKQSPERFFRLNFRVLDLSPEGKVTNSRLYSETIATGPKSYRTSSIRTGDRVPVVTSQYRPGGSSLSPLTSQYEYIDIGTKIDASMAEVIDQMLRLRVSADISSMSTTTPGSAERPVVRQTSWESNVTVPINKPTLIFSSDNSADRGKTELELTAVPIGQ